MITRISALILMITFSASAMAGGYHHHKNRHQDPPSFSTLDKDGNGWIELSEFSQHQIPHGYHEQVFNNIDADSDGLISESELTSHKPPHLKPRK